MKRQLAHTFQDIISLENLLAAWQEFVRGKRAKRDVQEFSLRLMDNLIGLHRDLAEKTYRHGGYHRFTISDPKPRIIHKASVRDRVLHHALYRILYPFFDRTFIADSFSCRLNKGTHRTLDLFRSFGYCVSKNHTRTVWILKCDIKQFFASIDQEILLKILKQYISDADILWLLSEVIHSFPAGLPLGNLTSQLFCNIYMNECDQFMKHNLKAKCYMRYADDFVIFSPNTHLCATMMHHSGLFLRDYLNLELHPQKIVLQTLASGVDFLGWVYFRDHRVLRTATKRRMMRRIRESPREETLASCKGLLRHGNTYAVEQNLWYNYEHAETHVPRRRENGDWGELFT